MLGVRLGEHHQFDVVRIAREFGVAIAQVFDLVLRERKAEACVGGIERGDRHHFERCALGRCEHCRARVAIGDERLRHRIVQQARERRLRCGIVGPTGDVQAQAAFDALDREIGAVQQLGRLARPWRDRAQARQHVAGDGAVGAGRLRVAGFKDAVEGVAIDARLAVRRLDPIREPCAGDAQRGCQRPEARFEPFASERRKGRQALEDDHLGRNRGNGPGILTGQRPPAPPRPAAGSVAFDRPTALPAASWSSAARSFSGGR